MDLDKLEQQLTLVMELDKLKSVLRRTKVKSAQGRLENSAEHSWHIAIMAIILQEHANEPIDIALVVKMLLLHDIVEIDAGDTFVYDAVGSEQQEQKELEAAKRLFGMLPSKQGAELMAIWQQFEQAETAEAKFAKACDRIMPLLMNYQNQGQSWKEHGISKQQVVDINGRIEYGSKILWKKAEQIIQQSVENGWLKP